MIRDGKYMTTQITITCGDLLSHVFDKIGFKYNFDGIHSTISSKNVGEFFEYLGFDLSKKAKQKIFDRSSNGGKILWDKIRNGEIDYNSNCSLSYYIKNKGYDDVRVNILIDDYSRNLDEWNEAFGRHGIAIKAINEINNKKKKNTYKKYIKII